jgi:hypothetical protein
MRHGEVVDIGPSQTRPGLVARLREDALLHPPEIGAEEEERQHQQQLLQIEREREQELLDLKKEYQQKELWKTALALGSIDIAEYEQLESSLFWPYEDADEEWRHTRQPIIEIRQTLRLGPPRQRTRENWEALVRDVCLALGRVVADEAVTLYGRRETKSAPRKSLDPGIWPRLRVDDWRAGNATADDGTRYFDICVNQGPKRGRSPKKIDPSGELQRQVFDLMKRRGDDLKKAEVEVVISEYVHGVAGIELAESTMRERAGRLMAEYHRRRRAGK